MAKAFSGRGNSSRFTIVKRSFATILPSNIHNGYGSSCLLGGPGMPVMCDRNSSIVREATDLCNVFDLYGTVIFFPSCDNNSLRLSVCVSIENGEGRLARMVHGKGYC